MSRFLTWLALVSLSCTELTIPVSEDTRASLPTTQAPGTIATASAAAAPREAPEKVRIQPEQRVGASHILISYKGALRARPEITRSKREAKQRAEEARAKVVSGGDFAELAREYSDDPSSRKGGDLGTFGRNAMVKPFADATFGLKVGEISDVVETEFGFHVIRRTQ